MLKFSLLLLSAASISAYLSGNCLYYFPGQNAFYDFQSFRTRPDDILRTENGKLLFNLCKEVSLPPECQNLFTKASGYLLTSEGHCTKILSEDSSLDQVSAEVVDGKTVLRRKSLGSPFTFEFFCKNDQLEPIFEFKSNLVSVTTRDACPRTFYSYRAFRVLYKVLLGLGMALGLFLAFFGGYLWNKIMGLIGFVFGAGTATIILASYTVSEEASIPWYAFIVFVAVVLLSGAAGSYIFILNTLLASVVVGMGIGVWLSFLVSSLLELHTSWLVVSCHIMMGLAGAFLSLYGIKFMLAIFTAISGSLLFTRSLSAMLHTIKSIPPFLNFLNLHSQKGELSATYIVIMVVLAIVGVLTQFVIVSSCSNKKRSGGVVRICD